MANIRKMQMVCTNCGNVRYLYLDENSPVMRRTAIQSLLCKKCNGKRKHMEKGVYSEEKVQEMRKDLYLTYAEQLDIDCSEIIINHAHSAKKHLYKVHAGEWFVLHFPTFRGCSGMDSDEPSS